MKLDRVFAREITKANGDGSREAKFALLNPTRDAAREMSNPDVMRNFNDIVKKYGRVAVGLCVAVTILDRQDRLEPASVWWAREVMKLWTNRPHDPNCVIIADGLHPTRIEEYAGSFIRLTTDTP